MAPVIRPTLLGATEQLRSELASVLKHAACERGVSDDIAFLRRLGAMDVQLAFDGVDSLATPDASEERHHLDAALAASTPQDQRCHFGRAGLARWRRAGCSVGGETDLRWMGGQREEVLADFIDGLDGGLEEFASMQAEVAGPNALVRSGLVTRWYLPNGARLIAKRSNPSKAGRLENECRVVQEVADRVGTEQELFSVVTPLAVLNDPSTSSIRLTIMADLGLPTVEDFLLSERRFSRRREVLRDCRRILDSLFAAGILWHDMSPRNILFEQRGRGYRYHLVDFEKAHVGPDGAVSTVDREIFCRGQIAVEEFGVLCSAAELVDFLEDYFDPDSWSLSSVEPIAYRLRPDLVDLLRGRSIEHPSEGMCNRLDQQIMQIRRPRFTGNEWTYPGHVGFRVEHYLSWAHDAEASEYDRRTTEALLRALAAGHFDEVADVLIKTSRTLEAAVVVEALLRRARVACDEASHAIESMKTAIDASSASSPPPDRPRRD